MNKIKNLKRTCVHVKPRASLCTSSCDPERDSPGAFALLVVGALNLGGLL